MAEVPGSPQASVPTRRGGMRAWIPLTIVALAVAGIIFIQCSQDTEGILRFMRSLIAGSLAVLLLLVWFVFLSRLRWRIRLAGLAVFVLAAVVLGNLVRMDGTSGGAGGLRLAWRWAPVRGSDLGELVTSPTASTGVLAPPAFDSPAYLGAEHLGVVRNLLLETNWTAHPPTELWRRKVGLGWSSFAVVGKQAVTQEQRGEDELAVCYELTSGRMLWAHTNQVRFREGMGGDGPRATPTIAEGRVYVMGATGILDCLTLTNGTLIWSRDTLKEHNAPNLTWGKSCSPLLVDDLVVVTGGASTAGPSLLAYQRADGSPAWKAGTEPASYPTRW